MTTRHQERIRKAAGAVARDTAKSDWARWNALQTLRPLISARSLERLLQQFVLTAIDKYARPAQKMLDEITPLAQQLREETTLLRRWRKQLGKTASGATPAEEQK